MSDLGIDCGLQLSRLRLKCLIKSLRYLLCQTLIRTSIKCTTDKSPWCNFSQH